MNWLKIKEKYPNAIKHIDLAVHKITEGYDIEFTNRGIIFKDHFQDYAAITFNDKLLIDYFDSKGIHMEFFVSYDYNDKGGVDTSYSYAVVHVTKDGYECHGDSEREFDTRVKAEIVAIKTSMRILEKLIQFEIMDEYEENIKMYVVDEGKDAEYIAEIHELDLVNVENWIHENILSESKQEWITISTPMFGSGSTYHVEGIG